MKVTPKGNWRKEVSLLVEWTMQRWREQSSKVRCHVDCMYITTASHYKYITEKSGIGETQLECCVQFGACQYKRDIDKL